MKPANGGMEEGFTVVKSILRLTQTLRRCAAENQLDSMGDLLEKRRRLLEIAIRLLQGESLGERRQDLEKQVSGVIAAIRQEDRLLLSLLQTRKGEVFTKLKEINNQKLLTAYSQ